MPTTSKTFLGYVRIIKVTVDAKDKVFTQAILQSAEPAKTEEIVIHVDGLMFSLLEMAFAGEGGRPREVQVIYEVNEFGQIVKVNQVRLEQQVPAGATRKGAFE
ncbi:hypothetical protein SAMN02990966_05959 [Rhodospirillales bacterium URHD0017]|nr:hypothetical protein SAMN02990966_05959 [Rhodospirillales bacterium URHD0017]